MRYPKIALVLGCFALTSESCTTYDPSLVGSGGAGGGGGSQASSGSGSSVGGGGGAKPCSAAAECPGMDDDCKKRACTGGVCGFSFTAKGTAIAMQTPHDCQEVVCDGQGNMETAVAPNDPPDDMLECTVDSCTMSIPMSTPKMAGTTCIQGGGKVCNDKGACVECIVSADCASKVCDVAAFKCSPAQCGDLVQNGAETDVDCGGPNCGKCALGKACNGDADCSSNHCVGALCYLDHLVINEVDYDNVMNDTAEFVEIYNGTGGPVNLAGYALVLVNGNGGMTYLSYDLSPGGTLAAGQYLVVSSNTVTVAAGAISLKFVAAMDSIQNGNPDGIALVDMAAAKLVDALSYKGPMTMVTVTGLPGMVSLVEGTALASNLGDSNSGQRSLCRLPSGGDTDNAATDWNISGTPTPGAVNVP